MVVFFDRQAKIALNEVNSGSIKLVAASSGDYDLYNEGDFFTLTDHASNFILTGTIIQKTRDAANIVTLQIEDVSREIRDYSVEEQHGGDPIVKPVDRLITDTLLPSNWELDTSGVVKNADKLHWIVSYAVRNGNALKHINNLCDMIGLRWDASVKEQLAWSETEGWIVVGYQRTLSLYDLTTTPGSASMVTATLNEYRNTSQLQVSNNKKQYFLTVQGIGAEQEVSGEITYLPYGASGDFGVPTYAYIMGSDAVISSIDLAVGATVASIDSGIFFWEEWDTYNTPHVFKLDLDDTWYTYDNFYDEIRLKGITAWASEPWYRDSGGNAPASTPGLALPHGLYDKAYLCGQICLDRQVAWASVATMAWIGSELIAFATYGEIERDAATRTTVGSITRGVNGVKYVHRKGAIIRPYSPVEGASTAYQIASASMTTTLSAFGFTELDGIDKFAAGCLKSATMTFEGQTSYLTDQMNLTLKPGSWVGLSPASVYTSVVDGATVLTPPTIPSSAIVKSMSYRQGQLVSITYGNHQVTAIKKKDEPVTAVDLVNQRASLDRKGDLLGYSDNKLCALVRFEKTTHERNMIGATYIDRWVRIG